MTAIIAGAPVTVVWDWDQIIWSAVRRQVYRLQVRIAKAVSAGRWNKVKALQYLLTHSFSGRLLAVKKVISNKGSRTAGIDGVIWRSTSAYQRAAKLLKSRGYQAQPLRRILIPKSNGKKRPLGIPIMHDRAMQSLYALGLQAIAETLGDRHSYGFRLRRSLHDAIQQAFICLSQRNSARWILDADIKAFFDRINHAWLLENIPLPKAILQQWLNCGYLQNGKFHDTSEGTPQGGIISPILANMTLDGLEAAVYSHFNAKRYKLHIIRYADDFIITGKSESFLRDDIQPIVTDFLKVRGLTLSAEKTSLIHIDEGFEFLGFRLRKFNGKLITQPSDKRVRRFCQEIKDFLKKTQGLSMEVTLIKLNQKLRGFATHARHVVSKRLFSEIDLAVYHALFKRLKRQHRNKTGAWIKQRYRRLNYNRHEWGCQTIDKEGKKSWLSLFLCRDVSIIRHIKVRTDVNPFKLTDQAYYQKRRKYQQRSSFIERTKRLKRPLQRLWDEA